MSVNFITGVPQEQYQPIQLAKRSSSLVNRIIDLFKNFFKRIGGIVISPLRRRKISVYKAPLPKEPRAVAKKAEEVLPAAPKAAPKTSPTIAEGFWVPIAPPEPKPVQKQIQQSSVPAHSPAVVPAKRSVKTVVQKPAKPSPQLVQQVVQAQPEISAIPKQAPLAQPVPQLPAQPIVVVQVIPFTITQEIKKLTDSILDVVQKQEKILKTFEKASRWSPPSQQDINNLYGQYQQIRDESKSIAQHLYTQQLQDIAKRVEELKDLSGKAQLGMDELEPMVKKGVFLGGLGKMLSSKEAELKRGFDFCKECRQTIQNVLNLPAQNKA